eukprot:4620448-Amphidinium_carterae.1
MNKRLHMSNLAKPQRSVFTCSRVLLMESRSWTSLALPPFHGASCEREKERANGKTGASLLHAEERRSATCTQRTPGQQFSSTGASFKGFLRRWRTSRWCT